MMNNRTLGNGKKTPMLFGMTVSELFRVMFTYVFSPVFAVCCAWLCYDAAKSFQTTGTGFYAYAAAFCALTAVLAAVAVAGTALKKSWGVKFMLTYCAFGAALCAANIAVCITSDTLITAAYALGCFWFILGFMQYRSGLKAAAPKKL